MSTCRIEAEEITECEPVTLMERQRDGSFIFPVLERELARCRKKCGLPPRPGDDRWEDPPLRRHAPPEWCPKTCDHSPEW